MIDAAKAGEQVADEIFDKFCDYLGYSLAATFKKYVWLGCRNIKFALAELGNNAGIYGAASMALEKNSN